MTKSTSGAAPAAAITTAETPQKIDIAIPRACASCESYFKLSPTQGKCRRNPPTVFTIFMPPEMVGGMPRPYSVSDWPIVNADQYCTSGYALHREGMT